MIVVDHGEVVEYDSPWALLQNQESLFYGMCKRSGDLEVIHAAAAERM